MGIYIKIFKINLPDLFEDICNKGVLFAFQKVTIGTPMLGEKLF